MQKISLFPSFTFEIQPIIVLWPEWPHPFKTMFNEKNFQSTFNFHEIVSSRKTQAISSVSSGDIPDLKILQSDWLRAFRSISQEP